MEVPTDVVTSISGWNPRSHKRQNCLGVPATRAVQHTTAFVGLLVCTDTCLSEENATQREPLSPGTEVALMRHT
jgi:hypothetical protein